MTGRLGSIPGLAGSWTGAGSSRFRCGARRLRNVGRCAGLARRKVASVMTETLSLSAVEQALVQAGGRVAAAARTLGIASASLRGLVRAHPLLADTVFEQIEQGIDAAQQVLWDGLRSDSAMTRMRAA